MIPRTFIAMVRSADRFGVVVSVAVVLALLSGGSTTHCCLRSQRDREELFDGLSCDGGKNQIGVVNGLKGK